MTREIVPVGITEIVESDLPKVMTVGQLANEYAAQHVFAEYQQRIAANTKRRQHDDLALFAQYLSHVGIIVTAEQLMSMPGTWSDITHGLVAGFVKYQLQQGYAIGSINVRLSTIKRYCALATTAGALPSQELSMIKLVQGYRHQEGLNVDARRKQRNEPTRKGTKKAETITITGEQARRLKLEQPDTPQGRRDALLMCLLLDHGLRCGEVAALPANCINFAEGTITFYRKKVDRTQTHTLTRDTLIAAMRYFQVCTPTGTLLMGSRKNGVLVGSLKERSLTERVRVLCEAIGIEGASAHDGRHSWATRAVKAGTNMRVLQDAGGWKSIAMPARYAESQKVANEGVKLD